MSTFKTLNIESDDEPDDEVDDTKEIQIEDALKDYQLALKYHALGPKEHDQTRAAYETLFASEIFKYPESQSEYERWEAFHRQEALGAALPIVTEVQTTQAPPDSGAGTLPQLLHLSYKNRGQFYLDRINASSADGQQGQLPSPPSEDPLKETEQALRDFAEALDKDELDLDLWRRTAKVSKALGSNRMARYCLEAALEDDLEEGTDEVLGMPSLEINLTANDLVKIQKEVEDDLSLVQLAPFALGHREPPEHIKKRLSLYPHLEDRLSKLRVRSAEREEEAPRHFLLEADEASWESIGQTILRGLEAEGKGDYLGQPGAAIAIKIAQKTNNVKEIATIKLSVQAIEKVVANTTNETIVAVSPEEAVLPTSEPVPISKESNETQQIASTVAAGLQSPKEAAISIRKRSTDVAELPETADGGRARSKRIRARESIIGEIAAVDGDGNISTVLNSELHENIQADAFLFEVLNHICGKAEIKPFSDPKKVRSFITQDFDTDTMPSQPLALAMKDFFSSMQTWDEPKTAVLNESSSLDDSATKTKSDGLSAYLESYSSARPTASEVKSPYGAAAFAQWTATGWWTLSDIARAWIKCLTNGNFAKMALNLETDVKLSSYMEHVWPSSLKRIFGQVLDKVNETLLAETQNDAALLLDDLQISLDRHIGAVDQAEKDQQTYISFASSGLLNFAQTMYELHLESYAHMTGPGSSATLKNKELEQCRRDQWCSIARSLYTGVSRPAFGPYEQICFRTLWATAFDLRNDKTLNRKDILVGMDTLRQLSRQCEPVILPNNSAIPEMSLAAADRELSKLETLDFFYSIFKQDEQDSVDVIERLEPVLFASRQLDTDADDGATNGFSDTQEARTSNNEVLARFFNKEASPPLRLSLWRRLRDAYATIGFPAKVALIDLISMGLILDGMKGSTYAKLGAEDRQMALLVHIRDLDNLLIKVLKVANADDDALGSLDVSDLRKCVDIVTDLWMILHVMALWDDHSQVVHKGSAMINPFRSYPSETFHPASIKFHEMQIRVYMLWYRLLVHAMSVLPDDFPTPHETRWEYLRHAHYALGVRRLCKASDSMFLRFMRLELLTISQGGVNCDDDISQILWDMYELHCFSQPLVKQDHGCDADYLDRATALELLDFVLDKARKVPIKDLIKSELGRTVEKLNTALGPTKGTYATARNKKIINNYLKGPINPTQLYRSLQGVLDVSTVSVAPDDAMIASKGWYFLRGQMALARYRASRVAGKVGDEDDLEEAINLFGQDLECGGDRWETWFRLAQANDALLEEQVLWSAEKLNNAREELAQLQRASIHSYAMAVACAAREIDASETTQAKLAELYFDFGMRIYSSARQPFAMLPFALRSFGEKHFSGLAGGANGLYTRKAFKPMRSRQAWRLAQDCFQRSRAYRPKSWQTEYMLGKCVWKQFTLAREEQREAEALTWARQAVDHFLTAIEQIPERKDRDKSEPTLEPIYKVVSVLHKLVISAVLPPDDGADTITYMLKNQSQFDANKLPAPCTAGVFVGNEADWFLWVLEIFKIIRHADKAKWHHRIVFNAAKIMYEQGGRDAAAAKTAKAYLLDEKMYSVKTLAISVWKPVLERPGRHWVYMFQYTTLLIDLLEQTQDIEAIQILTRRIRKKPAEFYHHEQLWPVVCNAHLRMHRRLGNVVENIGDTLEKSMMNDDFGSKGARLDAWISSPANQKNVLVDVLREVSEMRKINANLMNSAPIDRLCVDTYATIFKEVGPTLEAPKANGQPSAAASTAATPTPAPSSASAPAAAPAAAPPPPPRSNPMSLKSLMNVDGSFEDSPKVSPAPLPAAPAAPVSEAPSKPKARLVSMREILKRAYESVLPLSRPAAQAGGTGTRRADAGAGTASNVQIVISAGSDDQDEGAGGPDAKDETAEDATQLGVGRKSGAGSSGKQKLGDESSGAADSADESELSEPPSADEEDADEAELDVDGGGGEDEDEADDEDDDGDADERDDEARQESRAASLFPNLNRALRGATNDTGSDVEMSDYDGGGGSGTRTKTGAGGRGSGGADASGTRAGGGGGGGGRTAGAWGSAVEARTGSNGGGTAEGSREAS